MKVVAFLPAKGSSTRVASKNMKLLDGKPLFLVTLEKLVNSGLFDEVVLDTESNDVIAAASEVNCKVFRRDPTLATNKTDGNALFMNEVQNYPADIYVQVLATSPFISLEKMAEGIAVVADQANEHDSAVLVKSEKRYEWSHGQPSYNINSIPNSVDLPDAVSETMGLYVISAAAAKSLGRRVGERPYMIDASPLDAVDVNWPEEFDLANLIAAGMRETDRRLLNNIKHHMTSSLLSDLLDDLGYSDQIVRGLQCRDSSYSKILGRAKTLKLRKLEPEEDFKGIYDALHSYDTVVPNDVIVVENELPNFAYFGELNANLAIRAGAAGVIVNGYSRDSSEVARTELPVFSRGLTCQDVRKRATVESINKTINIEGVEVAPETLVFADREGVVVIPTQVEAKILNEVRRVAATEKKILADISRGVSVSELTNNHGFF